jgi:hypothetical protein
VSRFDQHFKLYFGLVVFAYVSLITKQGVSIAKYGIDGWLRGDGPFQTEWEVRAAIGLVLIGVPAIVIVAGVRAGEAIARRRQDRRWEEIARRRP